MEHKKGEKPNRKKEKVTKKEKQIALVDPGSKTRIEGKGWREGVVVRGRTPPSDRQRDEAVVLLDVTFENV